MKFIKKYYKYFIMFFFFLLVLLFFGYNNTDNIWNYGFSHAIRIGEVPYRDFNLISTPLYSFIMSIGLFVYDSYLVFLIEQAFMCTLLFFLFEKMFPKNYLLLLFIFSFPVFYTIFPNYNFMVLFLIILIMLLEEEEKNNYLIGFLLGTLILSKHTVGGIVFLCSLISCFSFSKILKRVLGACIPLLIFLIYLLSTKSFFAFLDLSIFGLFDFGQSNGFSSSNYLMIAGFIFGHMIWLFKKNYKNKYLYYLLGSFTFVLPICDYFHLNYLISVYAVVLLLLWKDKIPSVQKCSFSLIILVCIFNIFINYPVYQNMTFSSLKHFEGYLTTEPYEKYMKNVVQSYSKPGKRYMFTFSNMFFDITTNHDITYFDVPLYGNFGYKGISKMKKKIDQLHDVYFYIDSHSNIQYAKELYLYIKNKGEKIKSDCGYNIYYLK